MQKVIKVLGTDYVQDVATPLVAGDYNAYVIAMDAGDGVTGFEIEARRPDGVVMVDTGTVENGMCKYTLKTGIYSVPGDVHIRVAAMSYDAKVTERELRCTAIAAFDGTQDVPQDRIPALSAAIAYAQEMGDYAAKEAGELAAMGLPEALDAKANKNAPIIQNKLYVQTGTTDGATPAAPHMSIFPASDGACIRYGEGNIMTPTLKITENGLFFNQDGDDYKVYAENNKPPVDTALSSTSTNPVQNKAVHSALAEKANIDTPWFSGDAVFSGGANTTFNPKCKVLLNDNTAKLQFSSDISPIPDGLVFGDGSLKFLTAGKEYAVYTEGNPPPVERYNGASPIDPATVRDIFRCAMTYTNNKDSFAFTSSGNGTLFDADFSASSPKIDCSSLMMAWIMGIPYEYSKYAGKDNIKHYGYGIDLPANPYASDRPNRYYTHELAHYFNEQGWCFKPNENYSNIAPGDIIFVSFASGDGQSEFHDSAYMKIDHCLLVLGYKDATHLTCLHTSALYTLNFFDVPILPSNYDSTSTSNYNNAIKLVARLPFRRSCGLAQTPVATDVTEKTTTSTTNGLLATLTLSAPLKKNTPYTLIAHVENAAVQTAPSSSNYFGVRASYSSGASDATIFSWQRNVNPKDNLYRCYFVVEDDPITQLKLYVLSTSVAGHHYKFCGLFEGLVAPTPNSDGTFN